jgi:hypothetical protein
MIQITASSGSGYTCMYPLFLFKRLGTIRIVDRERYERAVIPLTLAAVVLILCAVASIGESPQWSMFTALAVFLLVLVRLLTLKSVDIRANMPFEATVAPARFSLEHSLYSLACVLPCVNGLLIASGTEALTFIALTAMLMGVGLLLLPFVNLIVYYSGRGIHLRG